MNKKQKEKFFNMKLSADGNSADIFIYGEITKWAWEEFGEVSSITFKNELDALGDDVETINLYINSPGGSVFEGLAIGTMLKRHKARVIAHVDALAASIASVIAMFADEIRMASNSLLMIHNAWTWASGNAEQLRKAADDIERINESVIQSYLDKAGDKLNMETLKSLLDAETWLSAEEAFNYGLCDAIDNFNEAAACIEEKLIKQYKNVPHQLLQLQQKVPLEPKQMSDDEKEKRQKIIANSERNIEYINTIIGGMLK